MPRHGWLAALALVLACGRSQEVATTPVTELESVDQLATAFNADQGIPRLILVLSPT